MLTNTIESALRQLETLNLLALESKHNNKSPSVCLGVVLQAAKNLSRDIREELKKQ